MSLFSCNLLGFMRKNGLEFFSEGFVYSFCKGKRLSDSIRREENFRQCTKISCLWAILDGDVFEMTSRVGWCGK